MKKFTTCNTSDKKKRHILRMLPVLTVAGALSIALTGCGTSSEDEVQRYSWPLATASPEDTVTQIFAEKFAEEVADLSDGKMKIQVFYSLISDVYTNGGYHLLGMADQGFRVMSTNKPVNSFADFKGQKIRTMENSYHLAFWKALGANPTPMSFSEVYIGLQQHTIDAQENPYEVIVSNNLYEQQDYVVETNHLPHLISLIVNDDFFKDLPENEQDIMTEAAQLATEYAREQSDARIADKIATIEESGTQIITLSDETRKEIREASKGVYDSIKKVIKPEIYETYMDKE